MHVVHRHTIKKHYAKKNLKTHAKWEAVGDVLKPVHHELQASWATSYLKKGKEHFLAMREWGSLALFSYLFAYT